MNTNDAILVHHGILGMKWGIRRYQNADGTLTELGKKHDRAANARKTQREKEKQARQEERARRQEQENKIKEQRQKDAEEVNRINEMRKRPVQLMTDNELNYMTNRLRQEQSYKQLLASLTPPAKKTAGDKIKETLTKFGNQFVNDASRELVNVGKNYLQKKIEISLETPAAKQEKDAKKYSEKLQREATDAKNRNIKDMNDFQYNQRRASEDYTWDGTTYKTNKKG